MSKICYRVNVIAQPLLVICVLLGMGMGALTVTGVAFAASCGDGSACTPYSNGVPPDPVSFGCAPGTCAGVCSPTGGPGGGGTSGDMGCKCNGGVLSYECARTVHWQYVGPGYKLTPKCKGTCPFGDCSARAPCEGVPGTWCDCPSP